MNWTRPEFGNLARLVRVRTGLAFRTERRAGFEIGVVRAMSRAGVNDFPRYHDLVATDGTVLDDLVVELTIPETYFFREPGQFEFLRRVVLPEIVDRLEDGQTVRAWSAGCSTGEEAYSLAILFAEEGLAGRTRLLATDISRTALAKAGRGEYGPWSLRGDLAGVAKRYLRGEGGREVIDDSIRRAVTFAHLNLAVDDYPSSASGASEMDLILCRNVLIYFEKDTVKRVARRLHESLSEGGWLLAASTDPPLGTLAPFESVVTPQGVFYRRARVANLARTPAHEAPAPAPPPSAARPARAGSTAAARPAEVAARPGVDPTGRSDGEPSALDRALAEARAALAAGRYQEAAARTEPLTGDAEASVLYVRALANLDATDAERACEGAARRHALSAELNTLHAVLLMGLGRDEEAARAARRALYLDRSLGVAHFLLGSILRKRGDRDGARRAFRNARDLCAARPAEEGVVLLDGETAGRLAESARAQLAEIDATGGGGP